ncbi:MAG TPA: hydantoinase/oxoprolinase family protein [Nitrolancea sp.]|nr:hydantoinase/oxoprolinase family protein [Nitrolancea sp.]
MGGTFTDVVGYDRARREIFALKVPSTPPDFVDGFLSGFGRLLETIGAEPRQVARLIHGTTIATNAVLEQKGARLGLLTTAGFEDVLIIGRQRRSEMYDLFIDAETPVFLAPRRRIRGISERIGPEGEIIRELDEDAVRDAVHELVERHQVEALAVCYLFSFRNPAHEERTVDIVHERYPDLPVSVSSRLDPRFREYERLCVTAFDAYVRPVMARYLRTLRDRLAEIDGSISLQVMQSRGGIAGAETALEKTVATLLSGPAAGVIGGSYVGRDAGISDLITIDIGGTSSDVALVLDGKPLIAIDGRIGTYPLRQPMIDVNTIGAGGGSVAWIDPAGALRVGPRSAGSNPGPACYGWGGTEPTVTDASLVLGYLNPDFFAGGEVALKPQLARAAILEQVAQPLGLELDVAAAGIHRIVNARMADQLRLVSIRRGLDPRRFALVPLGGAGPLHAGRLAEELGIATILIPPTPGVLSAFGLLVADIEHEHSVTFSQESSSVDLREMTTRFEQLDAVCAAKMERDRVPSGHSSVRWSCDMRYRGQSYELEVPLPARELTSQTVHELVEAFHRQHARVYGHANLSNRVEFVNLRSVHGYALERPQTARQPTADGVASEVERVDERMVYFDEYQSRVATSVYRRERLTGGMTIAGPAIIEQSDTTTVVYPAWSARVDQLGNLIMTLTDDQRAEETR